jgi:putative transposase
LNSLAVRASDTAGFVPRLVNGRAVQSSNPCSTKRRAEWQRHWGAAGEADTSRRLQRLTTRRPRRIDHSLHPAARRRIALLVLAGMGTGTRCIGQHPRWKQDARLRRRTNQTGVSVPHARFSALVTYTAEWVGIRVSGTQERYTSTASFLDADPLPVYAAAQPAPACSGRRVKRGLYRAANGTPIHADVNGAYTIIRTVAPEAFARGGSGCVVHPVRLAA